ncbi:MAG: DUF2130 domain-containing protein [Muribaculaceae bacterium]|nr:DUF2130 domain-containing protein [Muribaculaceae bacterium]
MNLKCPNCNATFEVDENHYAALLAQVRNAEFDAEIKRRLNELSEIQKAKEESNKAKAEQKLEKTVSAKDSEINSLKTEIERLKAIVANYDTVKKADMETLTVKSSQRLAEMSALKDKEIAELKNKITESESKHKLDITNQRNSNREELHQKEKEITELASRLESLKAEAKNRELELRNSHEIMMKAKDEEIERYKDMKSRLSTKMIGETLEQHCMNTFNLARSMGQFADAYFEKDNDASSGTKGDFIFRDYIDGQECLSIMFEMKNEADTTATKHKNEDFFAKLDKDRNEKKCEYAVLVSLLEIDSELYNNGIVDVSYRYPKMFVVRPQFFMPVIALLSKAARRSAETVLALRAELVEAKAQSIDVTKFEERRDKFAAEFMKFVDGHRKKHEDAMDAIDKAIASAEKQIDSLRKIKNLFDTSTQKLVRAGEVIENDFTIKKLTHGNPTMRAKFQEARLKVDLDAPELE